MEHMIDYYTVESPTMDTNGADKIFRWYKSGPWGGRAGLSDSCLNLDYFSALAIILITTGLLYRWIKSAVIFTLETHSLYNFQYTLLLKNLSDTASYIHQFSVNFFTIAAVQLVRCIGLEWKVLPPQGLTCVHRKQGIGSGITLAKADVVAVVN